MNTNFRFRKRLFELAKPEKGSKLPANLFERRENVVIDYDGSTSAFALLYLIRDALRAAADAGAANPEQRILHLPFTFTILFIHDELLGKDKSLKELEKLRKWQADTFSKYGLQFTIIVSSLEASLLVLKETQRRQQGVLLEEQQRLENDFIWKEFPPSPLLQEQGKESEESSVELDSISYNFPFNASLTSALTLMANNFRSETCRQDFLQGLRQNLLLFISKELGVKKILVAEDQTCLAIKMFSMMSLGRGSQLADQMSLTTPIQGIKLARPLMDLSQDDLREYMKCMQEEEAKEAERGTSPSPEESFNPVSLPIDNVGKSTRARVKTIYQQCEDFIVNLQEDYPSTVPTLSRIGGKLRPSEAASIESGRNGQGMRQSSGSSSTDSSIAATTTPAAVTGGGELDAFPRSQGTCSFCKQNRNDTEDQESHALGLCYGCTNIMRDMKDQSYFRELIHQS